MPGENEAKSSWLFDRWVYSWLNMKSGNTEGDFCWRRSFLRDANSLMLKSWALHSSCILIKSSHKNHVFGEGRYTNIYNAKISEASRFIRRSFIDGSLVARFCSSPWARPSHHSWLAAHRYRDLYISLIHTIIMICRFRLKMSWRCRYFHLV